MMFRSNSIRSLLGAGLAICAVGTASAQNPVTFSVDMNSQSAALTTNVYIRGSFNSWGTTDVLTNNGSGIYSGTFDITGTPGTVQQCKFFYYPDPSGETWESISDRQFILAGGAQTLPQTTWDVSDWPTPTNDVTFQVDMTAQILLGNYTPGQTVRVAGSFTGWGDGADLTNNPALSGNASNIYSMPLPVVGFAGGTHQYKFRANGGWENDPNRGLTLTGGGQVLPVVYYNDLAPSTPTNPVTFQVDMSAQILGGNYTPGQPIRVAGSMYSPSWGDGVDLTNNPALPGNASNIYSAVIDVIAYAGVNFSYKFRANFGWESPTSTGGNDRTFTIAGGAQVLPLVYYNDASLCDLLQQDTTVTFRLHITNGTTATDGTVFDRSIHTVHINGEFNGWAPWDVFLPQMVNNPLNSDYFEYTTAIPTGRTIAQKFKFSLTGPDNEAGFGADHIQYIRTLGAAYSMPYAEFGTNFASIRVESSFGNLAVGAPSGGTIPVTWLGRPCVTLQVRSSLTGGSWTDIPTTESWQSTNWPLSTGSSQFFRLQKRP